LRGLVETYLAWKFPLLKDSHICWLKRNLHLIENFYTYKKTMEDIARMFVHKGFVQDESVFYGFRGEDWPEYDKPLIGDEFRIPSMEEWFSGRPMVVRIDSIIKSVTTGNTTTLVLILI